MLTFVSLDDPIQHLIRIIIEHLASGVGFKPGHRLFNAFFEWDSSFEFGHEGFDLGIIKDHAVGFVAQQSARLGWVNATDKVGGDMDDIRLDASSLRHGFVNLVPGEDFVRGDMEGMTYGLLVTHKPYESLGKILRVHDRPERCPISVHNNLFPPAHALDDIVLRPSAERDRNDGIISQRWSHDGYRESFVPVSGVQALFTGDLVPGVLPKWISQRS